MLWHTLIVSTAVAFVTANHSPQVDYIDELIRNGARISDNIIEDAKCDVPDLITKYKYPFEEHTVTTSDGYILTMHRIPHGRDRNNKADNNKPTVFLMHGLLMSSADWVLMGPGCAFAYLLAEEGFDVWMGNARGNYYSRKHTKLNPDALLNTDFWAFSWDEIGNIDLPTMIDYVLDHTGKKRLHYVGHSQGTTSFFVMTTLRPEYNDKIISMHAFAPVAYMANNKNLLLKAIAPFSKNLERLASLIGLGEFMPNNAIMTWAGQAICSEEIGIPAICSNIMFLIGGFNANQHNATMLPVKLGHTPAGASLRQFAHYGQGIADKKFRRYDHGTLTNLVKYGKTSPPAYKLSKVTAPVFLHYSDSDPFSHVKDVDKLFQELGRPVGKFKVQDPNFSHLDFVWAIDAKSLLFDRTINLIWAMDVNAFDENV